MRIIHTPENTAAVCHCFARSSAADNTFALPALGQAVAHSYEESGLNAYDFP